MKFGVSTWAFACPFKDSDIPVLHKIAAMGFDGVEIPLDIENQFDVKKVGRVAQDLGLECVVMCYTTDARDTMSPDPQIRENGFRYLHYCVDTVTALGGKVIAGLPQLVPGRLYRQTEEQRKREFDLCVKSMRQVTEYAADHGALLSFEPLNRFETSIMTKTAEGLALVKAVGHPNIGLNLDTFHMNIEEKDIAAAIESAGKYLYHFHACENDRGTPGTGHIPWTAVAAALKRIGYDRMLSIETYDSRLEPIGTAGRAWLPFAPDMYGLASDGLAFLKRLFA